MFLVDAQGRQHIKPLLADVRGIRLRSVVVTEEEVARWQAWVWYRYLDNVLRPALLDDRCHIVIIGEKVRDVT